MRYLILLVFMLASTAVLALDYGRMPVTSIETEGGDVMIGYDASQALSPETMRSDIAYLLGEKAREFRDHDKVIVNLMVGDEVIESYSADIEEIEAFCLDEAEDVQIDQENLVELSIPDIDKSLFYVIIVLAVMVFSLLMIRKRKR